MAATKGPDIVSGIITNWLPLTTAGPASLQECSSALYFMPGTNASIIAFDPYYGRYIDSTAKCLAVQQTSWWEQHSDGVTTTNINLGPFACPTGYTTATESSMNVLTTVIGCCPSAYEYQGTLLPAPSLPQCLSQITAGQVVTAKSTISGFNWFATTTTVDKPQPVVGVHINGFIFKDPAETSSSISTPASTSSSDSSLSSSSGTSSKLGNGAKIGIGVGVSLGVVGLLCLLVTYLWRRRVRTRARATAQDSATRGFVEAPSTPTLGASMPKTTTPFLVEVSAESNPQRNKPPVEMWVPPTRNN